jgi:very-short-patch-repair endonuclease
MLDKKNKLSQIQHKLEEIKVEYEHFNKYCEYSHEQSLLYLKPNATSDVLMKLWFVCEKYVKRGKMPSLFERFINRIFFGIINRPLYLSRKVIKKEFYLADPNMMITICQKCWYIAKISELNDEIALLQKELKNFNFDQKMEEYSTLSLKLFCDYLSNKYKNGKRQMFELDNLWKDSSAFINEYPVILSTTFSLRSSLSSKVMYDYVIIDESSQVDLATGGLALSCAKKAVIVGDIKQLPNVVDGEASSKTDTVFNEFNLPEAYRYKNHSLLHSIIELFPKIPRILLKEHYRCHPKIIEFCNQKFYNNQLIILTESKCDRQPLLVYKTVSGNHARGRINQRQIDMIKEEIILNEKLDDSKLTIGIVTPYRDQTNALQKVFYGTDIQADTVDKFQGRERDVIILSTVDNEITEFTDDANRLNVAISRAIKQLIVVVNGDDNMIGKNIGDLVRYISYNNYEIINSNIHSIFDNLYRMYNEKRASLLQKHGKISEYDSENLIYGLIKDILKDEQFNMFGVTTHVPLKMIIRNMKKLNEEEKKYAQNYLTHVDFLIFDKISKVPRLVIEVDGVAFHGKGTKQEKRDELNNCILEKYGLPYRRFRTDGSSERRKIIEALKSVIKKNPAVSSPTLSATAP